MTDPGARLPVPEDMAWLVAGLREQGRQLLAADDLAQEVHRMLHGLESLAMRKRSLARALAAYQLERQAKAEA